ncbi:MAG: 16S rRNA (guanine(527)-N(7))-methyltransferase RsmG [Thermodesulfobacteriota bacterium]
MTTASDLFRQGINNLSLGLGEPVIEQLCRYLAELQKWNKRINLVAKATEEVLIDSHFLDSLTLVPLVKNCPPPGLMDVGSGAGFPGLVLKIACPHLRVTLVEPRQKRTSFLRQVIRTLGLQEIEVLETRLEKNNDELAGWRNSTPLLTSRAFSSINLFLDLAGPFCAPGGKVICMKGRKADEEINEWHKLSPASPFRLAKTIETALPFSDTPRKLLVFTKE